MIAADSQNNSIRIEVETLGYWYNFDCTVLIKSDKVECFMRDIVAELRKKVPAWLYSCALCTYRGIESFNTLFVIFRNLIMLNTFAKLFHSPSVFFYLMLVWSFDDRKI